MFTNKEYILTVYKEKSFTKASEKLYVSQPSLSASVKRIEEKISAQIFDRSTSPITLTETGKEYVKYALEIEQKERDFQKYVQDHMNLVAGTIKVGGSSLFSSFLLPKMIANFNTLYPKIQFDIFEDSTKNLLQKLNLGEVDIVIDNAELQDESISCSIITSETLILAVPKKFAVNDKLKKFAFSAQEIKEDKHVNSYKYVELNAFKNESFILLNPENDTGRRANKLFKKHEVNPKVNFYLDQQVTAYNISCSGLGISFISDTLIKHIDSNPDLLFYKLSDRETKRYIYLYRKNNRYLSLACDKFIQCNQNKNSF